MLYFLQLMQVSQLDGVAIELWSMFRVFRFHDIRKPLRKRLSGNRLQYIGLNLSRQEGG